MRIAFLALLVAFLIPAPCSSQTEAPLQWVRGIRKGPNEIVVKWSKYQFYNFKKYLIIRNEGKIVTYDYSISLDSLTGVDQVEYTDNFGIRGDQEYHYYIKVLGDSGNVLTTTDRWLDVGRWANLAPVQIIISNPGPDGSSVTLQWEQSNTTEFNQYCVFRVQQLDVLKKLNTVRTLEQVNALPGRLGCIQHHADSTTWKDAGLQLDQTYYYFVAVVANDNQALVSRPATVQTPRFSTGALSSSLKAAAESAAVSLSWMKYPDTDLDRYWLIRSIGPGNIQAPGTDTIVVTGTDTLYRDENLSPGRYSYQLCVKTTRHGMIAGNWVTAAIRPIRTGANRLRIWLTGETIKSANGEEYGIHPFFLNENIDDISSSGIILQARNSNYPLSSFIALVWKGSSPSQSITLEAWLKSFNIVDADLGKVRNIELALTLAQQSDYRGIDDAAFQDSLVLNVMRLSVRDTVIRMLKHTRSVTSMNEAAEYTEDLLKSGYPNLLAVLLNQQRQRTDMVMLGGGRSGSVVSHHACSCDLFLENPSGRGAGGAGNNWRIYHTHRRSRVDGKIEQGLHESYCVHAALRGASHLDRRDREAARGGENETAARCPRI